MKISYPLILFNINTDVQLSFNIENYLLTKKLAETKSCGTEYGQFLKNYPKDSALVVMIEGALNQNPDFSYLMSEQFLNAIIAYCIIKQTSSYYEIWDVCVLKRGTGVGANFISLISDRFNNLPLWLGVAAGNETAAKTYLKNGFVLNGVTRLNTSSNLVGLPEPFISMIRNPGPVGFVQYDMTMFNKLSAVIKQKNEKMEVAFYFSPHTITIINYLVKENIITTEIGGELLITELYQGGYNELNFTRSFIKGNRVSCPVGMNTGIPKNFTFHTHPSYADTINGLVVQSPSLDDLKFEISTLLTNMVFTTEMLTLHFIFFDKGFFTLAISPDFQNYIYQITNFVMNIDIKNITTSLMSNIDDFIGDLYNKLLFEQNEINKFISSSVANNTICNEDIKNALRAYNAYSTCTTLNSMNLRALIGKNVDLLNMFGFYFQNIFPDKTPDEMIAQTPIFQAQYFEIFPGSENTGLTFKCKNLLASSVQTNITRLPRTDSRLLTETTMVEPFDQVYLRTPEKSQFILNPLP